MTASRNDLRAVFVAIAVAVSLTVSAQTPSTGEKAVDTLFASWTRETPGCAVGAAVNGTPVLERAYGMADLEHDVPNTPATVFEAGSVSKQFTAAAMLLLVGDGKLSLDDPVRKYVPEVPDYGTPLTIRHMLTHTSGLRDWGEVAGIAGSPRTSRVYTQAHVLDIVSRQHALNFVPGAAWSYSNTGFNLAAIIVSRVSAVPFAQFSQERLFGPLGLAHTSWRDDYTRIVKQRAIAYRRTGGEYHQQMPFEDVYGNGGLLTTVGDLLRWNEHFDRAADGDPWSTAAQQTPGTLSDGRPLDYALGLYVRKYRGVREIGHSGSTAGYRAYLARYPDQHVSVAVLCNAADANTTQLARAVAEVYLGAALGPAGPPAARPGRPAPITVDAAKLTAYAGEYWSDEAEAVLTIAVEKGQLVAKRRPDTVLPMEPTGTDVFSVRTLGTVTFLRADDGSIRGLSVKQDRVWDLRFARRGSGTE